MLASVVNEIVMFTTVLKMLEDRCILSVLKVDALTVTLPPIDLSFIEAFPLTVSKLVARKDVIL